MTLSRVRAVCGTLLVSGLAFGLALGAGCGSSKASSGDGTTPATKKQAQNQAAPAPATAPAEENALVRVKEKMFPPVDVGAWVCEPKSWNDKSQALLHCTAPAGTTGLVAALKEDPSVADAEAAK